MITKKPKLIPRFRLVKSENFLLKLAHIMCINPSTPAFLGIKLIRERVVKKEKNLPLIFVTFVKRIM